jgi:Zn-dependent protease
VIARGSPFANNPFGMALILIVLLAVVTGGVAGPIRGVLRAPGSLDAWTVFAGFVIAIALGITVHEFMHAFTAHRFGDDTARHMGRLTLDPRAHLDVMGSLLILLLGFGYGKPVPVNEARLRGSPAISLVSLAGPLMNFALAAIAAVPLRTGSAAALGETYERILLLVVIYNCLLGIFNLIPVPPLDGWKVVYGLLPAQQRFEWRAFEQYGPFILLLVIFVLPILRIDVMTPLVQVPAFTLVELLLGRPVR